MLDEGPSPDLLAFIAAGDLGNAGAIGVTGPLLVVSACLLLSALYSGAEAGFLALPKIQVLEKRDEGHPRAQLLLDIMERPAELVSAMLIANTTVNVLLAIMWSILMQQLLSGVWIADASSAALIKTFLEVIALTVILVLFAEVTPKAWAHNYPWQFCSIFIPFIAPVIPVTRPAVRVFQWIAGGILRAFGIKAAEQTGVTEEELLQYFAAGEESGVIDEDERELIHSIFEFGDLEVSQVMVPRVEMISISEERTLEDALRQGMECGHSRLPVHSGDRDHIIGMLHLKDVLRLLAEPPLVDEQIKESDLVRQVTFVHGTKSISELFAEMKEQKVHIVIVVDEYGGTAGLVTIEDLLEELVGDIVDESDMEEPPFRFTREGELHVDGHLSLHDLLELIDWEATPNGVETIGGLVYSALGRVPEQAEEVDLGGLLAQVLEVEDNRIKELRLIQAPLTPAGREMLFQQHPDALLLQRSDGETDEEEGYAA